MRHLANEVQDLTWVYDESHRTFPQADTSPEELSITQIFSKNDVIEAVENCNFNKAIGPDGFDGTVLQ